MHLSVRSYQPESAVLIVGSHFLCLWPRCAWCCTIAAWCHANPMRAGFIPVLPATDKIQSKYHAAARMGINTTPTAAECCKHLSISGLHRILGLAVRRK